MNSNVCEDKLEFKNQRHKPTFLAQPPFDISRTKFVFNTLKYAINRSLLTGQRNNLNNLISLGANYWNYSKRIVFVTQ